MTEADELSNTSAEINARFEPQIAGVFMFGRSITQSSAHTFASLVTTFVITVFLAACATSPTGRRQLVAMPEGQMNEIGVTAFDDLKKSQPISKNAAEAAYVRCVANDITNAMDTKQNWEVVLFENAEPNAFALPGGKIGVHTGMLKVATTPSQLAAVLGHEVAHVIAQHSNERMTESLLVQGGTLVVSSLFADKESKTYAITMAALGIGTQFGVALPHGRKQESEADVVGLELMSKAGFDPRQAVELWRNMEKSGGAQPPEFMSTHPSHGTRIANLESKMPGAVAIFEKTARRSSCRL